MATLPYTMTQLNNTIVDTVPQAVDYAIRQESMLYDLVQKRPLTNSKGLQWQAILNANTSVQTYTPGSDLPAADAFENVEASMETGSYVGSLKLTHKQLEQLDLSERAGQMKLAGFIDEQMMDIARGFASKFHTDIISGAGPTSGNAMLGLTGGSGYWLDDAGTVAGISRASYTNWQVYQADNSGTTRLMTLALMDAAVNTYRSTISTAANFASGDWVWLMQADYAQLMRGWTGSATNFNAAPGDLAKKIVGYSDISYRNMIPVLDVPGYTTARADCIRLSALEMHYLPGKNTDGSLNGTPFIMQEPQVSGGNYTWNIFSYPLLRLRNPRFNAFTLGDLKLTA